MVTFFKGLFDYNHHYNQELVKVFSKNAIIGNERPVKLFSHILNAHHIWNCRIRQQPTGHGVWDLHAITMFQGMEEANYAATLQILEDVKLDMIVAYNNSKGEPFHNSVRDILFHIINHSTYHRGQIATLFRQNGIPPVITDYIFYKR